MMEWAVGALAAAAAGASLRWCWWRPNAEGLAVLMYHKIGEAPPGSKLGELWVTRPEFERQMRWLLDQGYAPLHLSDLDRAAAAGSALPPKPVLVTFDDGYRNNFTEAYPVLAALGVKASIFLVWETIDRHNAWHNPATEPWQDMLRWREIREMASSGLVEYGSHTMRHRNLESIPLEEARWEIEESKKRFEDAIGHEVPFFAYPYGAGAYEPRVRELAMRAGYRFDFSIREGKAKWPRRPEDGPVERLFIRGGDTRLDFRLQMTRGRSRL